MKLLCALMLLVAAAPLAAQQPLTTVPVDRWEKDISAFDAADKLTPFPKGGIVFVGSSTIRRWDVATYFPDLKILNRGFGGSELADAVRHIDRLVLKHEPRLVVVYAGDNDIGAGKLAEQVAVDFEHARLAWP